MKLYIYTDLKDISWLKYIVEEFRFIQKANFEIDIINEKIDTENIIFYVAEKQEKTSIFNSNEIQPNGRIEYLKDNLYILKGSKKPGFTIEYDLFWNAFVFLSRYEEYLSQINSKKIYSYSFKHPRIDKKSFEIPIVNVLFNELEKLIKRYFPTLQFGDKENIKIDFSHDVDYINKTIQLRLKQTAFNIFNTLKSIHKPKLFLENLGRTCRFALSNPSYWCFNFWQSLEKKYNVRSTFYVYVKSGKKNIRSWLIDPSYDIKTNKKIQKVLKELNNTGFKIGLHGSFNSAVSFEQLKDEKEILEDVLGIKVEKIRQHWLNYDEEITPYIHEKLFKYDSTIGWNDRIGFRAGVASAYRPYDQVNKKPFDYIIIPQVVMDSNLYDYANNKNTKIFDDVIKLLKNANDLAKVPFISVSWHQRGCSNDYRWHIDYEKILHYYNIMKSKEIIQ